MQKKQTIATWLGALLGLLMALALNASLAHGSDRDWGDKVKLINGGLDVTGVQGEVHAYAPPRHFPRMTGCTNQ